MASWVDEFHRQAIASLTKNETQQFDSVLGFVPQPNLRNILRLVI
ncbi:hypothetical protein [Scytonema sp. NUACC26]